jgi:hypothetical protein
VHEQLNSYQKKPWSAGNIIMVLGQPLHRDKDSHVQVKFLSGIAHKIKKYK